MRSANKIEQILKVACKKVGLARKDVEVGVFVVSPQRMRELNKQYRNKDKSTDVLSFPIQVKHDILHLGDIFINREDAKQNLPFLVAHGFLHLMGYDHELSLKEEQKMFKLQDEIIAAIGN